MKKLYGEPHFLEFTQEIQKFRARNPVCQAIDFCIKNALKLTYEHLEHKNFSGASPLGPPRKGAEEGRGGEGWDRRGGREGEGKGRGGEGEKEGIGKGREGREGKGVPLLICLQINQRNTMLTIVGYGAWIRLLIICCGELC
jgi:hypothetical protein